MRVWSKLEATCTPGGGLNISLGGSPNTEPAGALRPDSPPPRDRLNRNAHFQALKICECL